MEISKPYGGKRSVVLKSWISNVTWTGPWLVQQMDVYTSGIIVLKYFKASPHPLSTSLTSIIQSMDFSSILKVPKVSFPPLKPSTMSILMNRCIHFWSEVHPIRWYLPRSSITSLSLLLMPMVDWNSGTLIQLKNLKPTDGDILALRPISTNLLEKSYVFVGTKVWS